MRYNLLIILFAFGFISTDAQDMSISQSYAAPLMINPALAGSYEGNFRVAMLYRDQWGSILQDPFKSFLASGDARFGIGNKRTSQDHFGIGIQFYNDKVDPFDYTTNSILVGGAFHKTLSRDKSQYISAGAQIGIMQKNLSYEDFSFQDQFNGIDNFPLETLENLPINNFTYFDLNVGLQYTNATNPDVMISGGIGIFHVTEPNQSYYQEINVEDIPLINENSLKRRITGNLYSRIYASNELTITPRAIVHLQGNHQKIELGSGIRRVMSEVKNTAIHAGLTGRLTHSLDSYSFNDLIFMVGFEVESVIVGFSYDLNLSDLTTYKLGQQTFELSLRYTGDYEEEGYYCPQF